MDGASSCALREWTRMPVIFDHEHFTAEGSVLVAQRLQAARLIDQT